MDNVRLRTRSVISESIGGNEEIEVVGPLTENVAQENEKEDQTYSWLNNIVNYGSVVLENNGSVARDHLANERTWLAWCRTSLSFSTVGVGVVQLFQLNVTESTSNSSLKLFKALGCLFVSIGIITLMFGSSRYFAVQKLLQDTKFPASRLAISVLFVLAAVISCLTLGILIYSEK